MATHADKLEGFTFSPPNPNPTARRKIGKPASNGQENGLATTASYPSLPSDELNEFGRAKEKRGNGKRGQGGFGAHLTRSQSRLPREAKVRIVELFACFQTHKQVSDTLKAEFGLTIPPSTLAMYDPQRVACALGPKMREHYQEVRERYLRDAKQVAIAHQAHRLRRLEAISDAALASKDYANAIKALEIAAKEMGGLLEAGAGKLTVEHRGAVGVVHATVAEARSEVAMRLAGLIEKHAPMRTLNPAPEADIYEGGMIDVEDCS